MIIKLLFINILSVSSRQTWKQLYGYQNRENYYFPRDSMHNLVKNYIVKTLAGQSLFSFYWLALFSAVAILPGKNKLLLSEACVVSDFVSSSF